MQFFFFAGLAMRYYKPIWTVRLDIFGHPGSKKKTSTRSTSTQAWAAKFQLESNGDLEFLLVTLRQIIAAMQLTQSLCSFKSAVAVRPKASLRGE